MTPKAFDRTLLVVGIILGLFLLGIFGIAYGQHECQGGHNCNDDGGIVGGDISIANELAGSDGDFTSIALGQSLGDVDIAGCIVTTQWGIIIYQRQGFVYDVFCLADRLDQAGKYAEAAEMRCLHKIPRKLYAERCLSVMNFEPPESDEPPTPPTDRAQGLVRAQEEEEHDDRLDRLEERLDQDAAARRTYARQAAAEKKAEEQRASDAFSAYKAVQQMEEPQQQEEPPNE